MFVLSLLLVACSDSDETGGESSSGGDGNSEEKVTLDFWVFGQFGFDGLVEKYNEENPNVEVNLQLQESEDMHNNLFTSLSAGSGAPDISMIEIAYIPQFREAQDHFYNLYDYGADDVKNNFLDWAWKNAESPEGDYMIALPTDIGPTAMYYRTDIFEEAGLPSNPDEVAELISTWDDYVEVARTIKSETGTNITDSPELLFNAVRDQAPEQYFNEDNELIIETSPYVKEAYDFATGLIQEGLVGQNELWTPEWGNAMSEGTSATLLAASWMVGRVKENAPDAAGNWAITTLPEGAGNWGGSFISIPKQSEYPEEAYEFISWLTSPEQLLEAFNVAGIFPSTPGVYEDEDFLSKSDEYFSGTKTASVFADAAQKVEPVFIGKDTPIVHNELVTALINVASADGDPEEEWNNAVERIKDQLARN